MTDTLCLSWDRRVGVPRWLWSQTWNTAAVCHRKETKPHLNLCMWPRRHRYLPWETAPGSQCCQFLQGQHHRHTEGAGFPTDTSKHPLDSDTPEKHHAGKQNPKVNFSMHYRLQAARLGGESAEVSKSFLCTRCSSRSEEQIVVCSGHFSNMPSGSPFRWACTIGQNYGP